VNAQAKLRVVFKQGVGPRGAAACDGVHLQMGLKPATNSQ
jgi:hypothetical protein